MKIYQTSDIRNIALVGGAKSGKTTLAEAMAFCGGVINRRGTVEDKNTISDYRDIEIDRRNSVNTSLLYTEFGGKKINILDVPGFADFQGELVAAFNVVEAAVVVVNAQSGIEVGTEIAYRYSNKVGTPMIFTINHLDAEKANFDDSVNQLKDYFGSKCSVLQFPVNQGLGFNSVVDIVLSKMLTFKDGKVEMSDIPAEFADKAEEMRSALVEEVAAADDALMEKFFEEGDLSHEDLSKALKLAIDKRELYPILCTSAKENMGVARLLEFINDNVPAPNEVHNAKKTKAGKELKCDNANPSVAFVFKTAKDKNLGEIAYVRIYDGELAESQDVVNSCNQGKERLSQVLVCAGKNRQKVEKASAGDIICTIKLKDVKTNHTLTTLKNADDVVTEIEFPVPIHTVAVKAANSNDDEKVGAILNDMCNADRSLTLTNSRELRQLILGCQGELHLNTLKWYFANVHKLEVNFTDPRVPYRETITKSAEEMYRHKKQSGGSGQFGEVHMLIEPYFEGMPNQTKYPIRDTQVYPLDWGGQLVFNNCIVGGSIDARFMPAILKGIMEKMEQGPLTGSYARDIVVNIYDGKMHPVDSNETAFKIAGRTAFREAFRKASPKIMEPIYDIAVTVPTDNMGGVMTDLQGRRAIVMGMDAEGKYTTLRTKAPLAEMNRYCTALSSLTSGRGTFTMKYAEYQQVPTDVQNALLKAYEEQQSDED
ncbi:MAG: elongation factor G [Bacteroidales bacterium]|nr:elongation factor G [Candidatus Colimorpha onthohippi]